MKKLLALVMALVMVMGLATVGTSAAYADQDDINYEEAVDVMSAIGVLAGDETGFRPADTLKRSEGAKIVAYLLIGNKAAEALQGSGTKFTDLPANHWASGYMEYLASVGVMGGVGDGKIDPDGSLTATAFGKMLLVALGYDAEIEGFGGPDWSINVQKVANTVGLYDGNRAVVGSAAVTREEAAQYAFNALKTPIVEYDTQVQVSLENGSIKVGSNKAKAITSAKLADQTISEDEVEAGKYYVEFAEKYYPDLELIGHDYTADEFGRPSREWTYNKADVGTYIATAGLLKTFTGKVTKQNLYDTLGKTVYDSLSDRRTELNVAVDGLVTVYQNRAITAYSTTGYSYTNVNVDNYLNRNDTGAVNGTGNGSVTQVFMDEDSNVYVATYHTYVYQAASDYNATKETLLLEPAGDTAILLDSLTLEAKDFPEIKDYKEDDYILVTASQAHFYDLSRYSVYSVDKAELVTGTVEGYKTENNVTIDGTTYAYSNKTLATGGNANVKATAYSVGRKATVVLDKYSNVIAVDDAVVDENYVFIAALGNTNATIAGAVLADAYFTDGTNKSITVSKLTVNGASISKANMVAVAGVGLGDGTGIGDVSTTNGTAAQSLYAGWYTFATDDDGSYMLTSVSGTSKETAIQYAHGVAAAQAVQNDRVLFASGTGTNAAVANTATTLALSTDGTSTTSALAAGSLRANDKTIMVVSDGTDVFTYTGVKNLPDITIPADAVSATDDGYVLVYAVYNSSNYASYVFVTMEGDVNFYDAASTSLLYVISKEGTYTTTNNKVYTKYNVLDETGTKVVVEADGSDPFGTGNIYQAQYRVSKNASDRYSRGLEIANDGDEGSYFDMHTKNNGIAYSAGTLALGGQNFTLADDAKITVVSRAAALNKDKDASYEVSRVSASALASMVKNYTVTYNVQGQVDGTYAAPTSNRVLKEAYVTITAATTGAATPTVSTSNNIVAVRLPLALRATGAWQAEGTETPVKVYYTGTTAPTVTDIQEAMDAELALYGLTVKSVAIDATNNADFEIMSASNSSIVYANKLRVAMGADRVAATVYNGSSISNPANTTGVLVVPKGQTVAINETHSYTTLIVDGTVNITKGNAATAVTATNLDVLKSGHVTVSGGATLNGGTLDVDGSSLVVTGTATLVDYTTVNVIGKVTVTGGTIDSNVNVLSGNMTLNDSANVKGDVAVSAGATLDIDTADKAGVDGTISGAGTVTTSTATMTGNAASTTAAAKPTLTITDSTSIVVQITTTNLGDEKSSGTYYVNGDTVTITVKNLGNAEKKIKAAMTSGEYTVNPSDVSGVAKNGTAIFNVKIPSGKTSDTITFTVE